MTAKLDKTQVYLVPVAHLDLPDEPEAVHLALYYWQERIQAWISQTGVCGRSTTQGALPEGTEVTCQGCLKWQPVYEQVVAGQNNRRHLETEARRKDALAEDTPENGAWHTVWFEGNWSWVTNKMSTAQREYAADRVAAYSRYLAACDGDIERDEPDGLRWWREVGR